MRCDALLRRSARPRLRRGGGDQLACPGLCRECELRNDGRKLGYLSLSHDRTEPHAEAPPVEAPTGAFHAILIFILAEDQIERIAFMSAVNLEYPDPRPRPIAVYVDQAGVAALLKKTEFAQSVAQTADDLHGSDPGWQIGDTDLCVGCEQFEHGVSIVATDGIAIERQEPADLSLR